MDKKIKVLICDDSAVIRQILSSFIGDASDMELVGTAVDPYDAREKIKRLNPDVLTLDIEMPRMDGLSFLEKIMTLRPMPVIMVSTLTQRGASATLQALEIGAFDYIGKPSQGFKDDALEAFRHEILGKIRAAAQSRIAEQYTVRGQQQNAAALAYTPPAASTMQLIALGASTGGVEALRDVFQRLPGNLPPIVATQHMPASFTTSFAARLNGVSAVTVELAAHGTLLQPGHGYIAPGGKHLTVVRRGRQLIADVREGPTVSGHCPSVDVLFHSVAQAVGGAAIGAIFTGMGKDGAAGLLAMQQAGARTLGQDEASSIVYGMPKAAYTLGAVNEQVPLMRIADRIVQLCEEGVMRHAG